MFLSRDEILKVCFPFSFLFFFLIDLFPPPGDFLFLFFFFINITSQRKQSSTFLKVLAT